MKDFLHLILDIKNMTYFDVLPIELRMELLKYFHISLLISSNRIGKFELNRKKQYMFDIESFKSCDNEVLWESLYKRQYSVHKPINTSYKEAYINHKLMEVTKRVEYLKYAAQHGLEKEIAVTYIDNDDDYFRYNIEDILVTAVKYRQLHVVKDLLDNINFKAEFLSQAVIALLTSNFPLTELAKVEEILAILMAQNAVFPKVSFANDHIFFHNGGGMISHYLVHEKAIDFIKFLLKYNAIPDHQVFLEKLCRLDDIAEETIKWCIDNLNVTLTENLFRNLRYYKDHLKCFLVKGYEFKLSDVRSVAGYMCFDNVLEAYIEQQCKKRKISE